MSSQGYPARAGAVCGCSPRARVVKYIVICVLVVLVMADRETGAMAALSSLGAAIAAIAPLVGTADRGEQRRRSI